MYFKVLSKSKVCITSKKCIIPTTLVAVQPHRAVSQNRSKFSICYIVGKQ
ncbi:hypothetical protein HanIR_Chr17g0855391 [Helianthus annuus]|nr:hypothetical protein HanIR_Chr17g0855391 [Helianthus annuus]